MSSESRFVQMHFDHYSHMIRNEITLYGRRLVREGLIIGTAGNISVRTEDGILITPSGKPYQSLQNVDICRVSLDGVAHPSNLHAPSSETAFHLGAYANSSEVNAVVHYHGLHSAAVASSIDELPVIHYYAMRLGGAVPVVPYSTFGGEGLAQEVGKALKGGKAALMQNHGGVAVGRTLHEAFDNAALLEWLCKMFAIASGVGTPRQLSKAEMAEVADKYATRNAG